MPVLPQIAALVLAGGRSTRMERFKPLLPLHGQAVLERAIASLAEAGVDEIVVVLGHRAGELRPIAERAGARCVFNPHFDEGMYSSVFAGVQALGPSVEAALVLPGDLPAVRARTVALLIRSFHQTGAEVVYPAFRGERGHPPVVSARLFKEILGGDGRGGLQRVLASHEPRALELGVLDEGVLLDLDTPADYQRALELCRDRSVPSPAECEALLGSLRVHRGVALHGKAVERAAAWLGARLAGAGLALDLPALSAAARLHDLAKGSADHARRGAEILAGLGFAKVAALVAAHMDLAPRAPLDEAALLFLADKLVKGERLVGLAERFRAVRERFAGDEAALRAAARRREAAEAVAAAVGARLGDGWAGELERGLPGAAPCPAARAEALHA